MKQVDIEHLLPLVDKPSRYIDHELNAVYKSFEEAEVRFAFAFPDVYELGISHLGIKILYSIINNLDYAMADRAYLPWVDLSELMRAEGHQLFAWESRIELREFDVLGITLQSELNFSNVLELIDLAGISIHAADRLETDPIIMAGGPCATNPLPLAPFVDVFFIGEAEEGIVEIAEILKTQPSRKERLSLLSGLSCCYVPSYGEKPVSSRKYTAFHESKQMHQPQLLSWQLATHNRYVAEIMRGCSRGCRFCHAGYFYRPVRERDPRDIIQDLLKETQAYGWDEAGLISLSSSDYSCIQDLLIELLATVDTAKTHISLPSLRVDSLSEQLVEVMRNLGREGLTIAPEAGSERLRRVINKNLSEAEIIKGIETAIRLGWQKIKLYFMLGLPTEEEEDIDAIIALIEKVNTMGNKRLQINVTLSPFVPKPFTPFQWCAMLDRDTLLDRARRIKAAFAKPRNIKIKYHTIETSILEAAITRGDIAMAKVIESAWKHGARFDAWNEGFDFSHWEHAFVETGVKLEDYLAERDTSAALPWDFVDTGVCKTFLLSEWDKARSSIQTPDCRELCTLCGVCTPEIKTVRSSQPLQQDLVIPPTKVVNQEIEAYKEIIDTNKLPKQFRYRVYYQKLGLLRFISHLDWMRMLFRRIAILELKTVFTQGFSPHPKVSLSPPLPVGVEGFNEYFDISFNAPYPPELILKEFRNTRIPEFNLLSCEPLGSKVFLPGTEHIVLSIPPGLLDSAQAKLREFQDKECCIFNKSTPTRSKSYDLCTIIKSIVIKDNEIHIHKLLESPSLYDVLSALFAWDKKQLYAMPLKRIGFDT